MNVKWHSDHGVLPLKGSGVLVIEGTRIDTVYAALPVPSDWGEGWELRKCVWDQTKGETRVADVYHVNLDGRRSTCDCLGFTQYQKPCKHLKALLTLKGC